MFLGNRNVQPDARSLRVLLAMDNMTPDTYIETIEEEGLICGIHCQATSNFFAGEETAINVDAGGGAQGNVGLGYQAMHDLTTADANVAAGYRAAYSLDTGSHNVAISTEALYAIEDGTQNIAIGYRAVYSNVSDTSNIGLGYCAAYTTTGEHNLAAGYEALYDVTTGDHNIGLGYEAGAGITTGSYNIAIGHQPMHTGAVTGVANIAAGYQALDNVTSGSYNTCIGYQAGDLITTGSYNICLGKDTDPPLATSNAWLNIGDTLYGDLIAQSVGLNTLNFRGGDKCLALGACTNPPAGVDVVTCIFYVTGGEMWVIDGAGNTTQLSPHDDGRWVFHSIDTVARERVWVDMEGLAEAIQELTGKDLITRTVEPVQGAE